MPHGAGGCTASATESAIMKEIRDMKRQQQQGMEKILDEIRELKQELKRMQEKTFQIRGTELQVFMYVCCLVQNFQFYFPMAANSEHRGVKDFFHFPRKRS